MDAGGRSGLIDEKIDDRLLVTRSQRMEFNSVAIATAGFRVNAVAQTFERLEHTLLFFCSTLLRCDLHKKKVPGRTPYSQHIMIRNWT